MHDPAQAGALVGEILSARYRIEALLGEGGMGEVYLARHERTGRQLAVKLLSWEAAREPENLLRFEREARTLGALGHPNIVGIHDFDEAPDGRPYLVMDYLEGEELADRLDRVGRLDWATARGIFEQVCAALHAAHSAGVLHRDLKPGNIYLARNVAGPDRVLLLDFGLAKSITDEEARVTRTGMIVGTPLYMPPEQARGADLDVRSDVYSLGAVLFEMLAGRPPFTGSTWTAVLTAVLVDPPPMLSQIVSVGGLAHLDSVIAGALAKDPEFRPPDVATLAERVLGEAPAWSSHGQSAAAVARTTPADLSAIATGALVYQTGPEAMARTTPAGLPAAAGAPVEMPTEGAGPSPAVVAGRRTGRRLVLLGLVALALAGAGIAVGLLLGRTPSTGAADGAESRSPGHRAALASASSTGATRDAGRESRDGAAPDVGRSRDGGPMLEADVQPPRQRADAGSGEALRRGSARPAARRIPRAGRTLERVRQPPRAGRAPPRGHSEARGDSPRSRRAGPRRIPARSRPAVRHSGSSRTLTREALMRALPANERAILAAIRRSDWVGCIRVSRIPPVTLRVLQMRLSCANGAGRSAVARKTCKTIMRRYPRHPMARSCAGVLRGLEVQKRLRRKRRQRSRP